VIGAIAASGSGCSTPVIPGTGFQRCPGACMGLPVCVGVPRSLLQFQILPPAPARPLPCFAGGALWHGQRGRVWLRPLAACGWRGPAPGPEPSPPPQSPAWRWLSGLAAAGSSGPEGGKSRAQRKPAARRDASWAGSSCCRASAAEIRASLPLGPVGIGVQWPQPGTRGAITGRALGTRRCQASAVEALSARILRPWMGAGHAGDRTAL